jgi:hypothetical protein
MMRFLLHPPPDDLRASDTEAAPSRRAWPRHRLRRHLARCADCRAVARLYRELPRLTAELPDVPPPVGLRERVLASRASGQRVLLPVDAARATLAGQPAPVPARPWRRPGRSRATASAMRLGAVVGLAAGVTLRGGDRRAA